MIEIDGEFFEDPCEIRKQERIVAIMETLTDTLFAQLKAEADNAPEIVIHAIRDIGAAQMGIIRTQPLWPPPFAAGGIVQAGQMTGDIVTIPKEHIDIDTEFGTTRIILGGVEIGIDPAAPGGDRCFQGGVEI